MSNDKRALDELAQASDTALPHVISHYLYFAKQAAATQAATELRTRGFDVEERLGADGINWLVLATQHTIPSDETVEKTRQMMEDIAVKNRGEYDGWEAETRSSN